jgi:molecular chaperone HscB
VKTLQSNDFELFDLPQRFALDRAELDARWKALQRQAHPDRFAAEGGAAQRLAMQWSVRINEAYQRLKLPLSRATYLCQLRGVNIDLQNNTAMPTAFLMQQMQWHEALQDVQSLQEAQTLCDALQTEEQQMLAELARCLDEREGEAQATQGAAEQVRALLFVQRLLDQVNQKMDGLSAA